MEKDDPIFHEGFLALTCTDSNIGKHGEILQENKEGNQTGTEQHDVMVRKKGEQKKNSPLQIEHLLLVLGISGPELATLGIRLIITCAQM